MADEIQSSQIISQVEYEIPSWIESSQVITQVEWVESSWIGVSQNIAQIEYSESAPSVSVQSNVIIITG